MEVVRRIPIRLPLLSDWCTISVCNVHKCVGHSTLVDRILLGPLIGAEPRRWAGPHGSERWSVDVTEDGRMFDVKS